MVPAISLPHTYLHLPASVESLCRPAYLPIQSPLCLAAGLEALLFYSDFFFVRKSPNLMLLK